MVKTTILDFKTGNETAVCVFYENGFTTTHTNSSREEFEKKLQKESLQMRAVAVIRLSCFRNVNYELRDLEFPS